MNMPSFDTLSLDKGFDNDISWEGKLSLNNESVDAALWVTNAETLNPEKLRQITHHCQNIHTLYERSQTALIEYVEQHNDFIVYHFDNIEQGVIPRLDVLRTGQFESKKFVTLLKLQSISIWITSNTVTDNTIWLDYSLDTTQSVDMLTVQFTLDGHIKKIVWDN